MLPRRSLLRWGFSAAATAGVVAAPALGWAQAAPSSAAPSLDDAVDNALKADAESDAAGVSAPAVLRQIPATLNGTMRSVSLDNLHTGESIEAVYWDQGQYIPDVLDAVNTHLRDYRTGDIHPIDPNLLDLLDTVSALTGTKARFQVISGYRSPKTNEMLHEHSAEVAKKSLHVQGMAIDIRLPDVQLAHLHQAALSLGRGGVGFYPESNFVHIDVGPVRSWRGA